MQAWLIIERNTNHTGTAITYHGPFASPESASNWADINCNEKADGFELVPLFVPLVQEWDSYLFCPECGSGDTYRHNIAAVDAISPASVVFIGDMYPLTFCDCRSCGHSFEMETK